MMPGGQLLIAKQGSVIHHKSYGYHTYDKLTKVNNKHIYDLASLTKILVTVPLVMREFESKDLKFNTKLSELLPNLELLNKKNIPIDEMLSHYARLKPWIPFYKETIDSLNKKQIKKHYSLTPTNSYVNEVREGLFMKSWNDTILNRIISSDLMEEKEYKYSDFPYYFLKEFLEKKYSSSLDELIKNYIYDKVGANSLTYNPTKVESIENIAPSEIDEYFRMGKLQGYVHDMGAAMQGGVGGHAGLFGNSLDVAKIMQLYLQSGTYENNIFFTEKTFKEFNKCHFCNKNVRRGIGFDKPDMSGKPEITCGCVSPSSFGHSGFTGTYAWADPNTKIVYVFLSNRTFPTMENKKLIDYNIRTEIKKIIFE